MTTSYTASDLREQQVTALQMHEAALAAQREHLEASNAATDPVQKYIADALEQIQGCHARHFKRIADAYALAAHEVETR